MKKTVILFILFFIAFELGWHLNAPKKETNIDYHTRMLIQVKQMLMDAYVPDSIKNQTHDASHNLMYADPDGNDYWSARGTIHQTEEFIKTCKPCMYIDSILKAKEDKLKIEQQ